jgi:hypothetical protein
MPFEKEPEDIFAEIEETIPEKELKKEEIVVEKKKPSFRFNFKIILIFLILAIFVVVSYFGYSIVKNLSKNLSKKSEKGIAPARVIENIRRTNQGIDSDFDGLLDSEELELKTNPFLVDTDNDGLFDKEEVKIYKTNPLDPDTDNDNVLDGDEVKKGYDPNNPDPNAKLLDLKKEIEKNNF